MATSKPTCPRCGSTFDGVRSDGSPPKEGDYTICFDCACPLRVGPNGVLVELTLGEVDALPPEIVVMLAALAVAALEHGAEP